MSVENDTTTSGVRRTKRTPDPSPIRLLAPERRHLLHRPKRPRVHKLRFFLVLGAFGFLAIISMLFGALTSIASDLPGLSNTVQFRHSVDSYMYDVNGNPIGPLAPTSGNANQQAAIDDWHQISPNMRNAIVAIEDRGFWHESGISVRGLLRAALNDVTGGATEGGSTIPEEFIKNVRTEEDHRTIAEKLVEAAMAFQLSHHWTRAHILTEYLNTIYFGNGALGIEAAARIYFGWDHGFNATDQAHERRNGCGDPTPQDPDRRTCASMLTPAQAALLAGMVANPSAFNPAGTKPERTLAKERRNLVLQNMYQQHDIKYWQLIRGENTPLPTAAQIQQPEQQPSAAPYFTSWVEPLVVRALEKEGLSPKAAQYEADYGGLKIKLSIDLNLQNEAQQAIDAELPPGQGLPTAALVAIDNRNGEVRAMVSGTGNYNQTPFNLATMGYRQPGSSFKIFTLAAALSHNPPLITPYTPFDSEPITIHWYYKTRGDAVASPTATGKFPVRDFGNVYSGEIPMTVATATSDNSVFAQLGTEVGTGPIAHYARLLGIRSPISRNPSMILGGLKYGVSPLDMAHAYSTVADGGVKITNRILGDVDGGPIGIASISGCGPCRQHTITNYATLHRTPVLSPSVAETIDYLLHGPVQDSYGTGTAAAIPGVDVAGKTGTTSNYADAWFVGWTPQLTVAVWVGYPNSAKPMTTQFGGHPVEGGTYPAIIWHNFQVEALQTLAEEAAHPGTSVGTLTSQVATNTYVPSSSTAITSTTASTTTQTTPTTDNSQLTQTTGQETLPTNNSTNATQTPPPAQTETLPQNSTTQPASTGSSPTGGGGSSGL